MTDFELLRGYASSGCEGDFTVLVGRYANLVYSAALRQTRSPHDAEEICQTTFIILARKAGTIREGTVLAGWLLRTTRFVAQNARRREANRRCSEREAIAMGLYLTETHSAWQQFAPKLDEALVNLSDKDRDAVVLRFFEKKSFREISRILGISEDTAQKRVARALDRLRNLCVKRGVLTSAVFAAAISSYAVQAAPNLLVASIVGSATGEAGSVGVRAALAALERDRLRSLGIRCIQAVSVALVAVLALYLVWSKATPGSPSGNGAARSDPIRPPQGTAALVGGDPSVTQADFRQLRLRVVDAETDAPVRNARVTTRWGILTDRFHTNSAVTDAQGECVVAFGLEATEYWAVLIHIIRDGYVPKFVNWTEPRGDLIESIPAEYTTKLSRGQIIGGVVLSDGGEMIPDAKVIVDGPFPSLDGEGAPEREGVTIVHAEATDAQGRWLCNHVPPSMEQLQLSVLHPSYMAENFRVTRSQDVSNAKPLSLSEQDLRAQTAALVLRPGLVVAGVVMDEDGKAIVGATVTKDRAWYNASASATTGTDGGFRFANVTKAELILTVQADGFVAQDKTAQLTAGANEIRFRMARAAVLRGVVVDKRGTPIPQATVVARDGDFGNDRFEWFTRTDENGKFTWRSVPPGHQRYQVYADWFGFRTNLSLTADGNEQRITLFASSKMPRFRISGSVNDFKTGQPIDAFEVWVSSRTRYGPAGAVLKVSPKLRTTGLGGKFAFLTDPDFTTDVESYGVEIRADGYLSADLTVPGQWTNDYKVGFSLKAGARLVGIVRSPEGETVSGAFVLYCVKPRDGAYMESPGEIDRTRSSGAKTKTDAKGAFSIPTTPGTGILFIAHESGFASVPVVRTSSLQSLRLESWGRITGSLMIGRQPGANETIYLGNGFPASPSLPRVQVHLTATTDDNGHFVLNDVPPGEWYVSHVLKRRGHSIGRLPLIHTTRVQVSSGQISNLRLGGSGRKVVGKLRIEEAGLGSDLKGWLLMLRPELPGLTVPVRQQFASDADYDSARAGWSARRFELTAAPAGREALAESREYLAFIENDGSIAMDDVMPGVYDLEVEIDPGGIRELSSLRPDPVVAKRLNSFSRRVVVPETSGQDEPPIDLGILEPNLNKVGQHQQ